MLKSLIFVKVSQNVYQVNFTLKRLPVALVGPTWGYTGLWTPRCLRKRLVDAEHLGGLICVFTVLSSLTQTQLCLCCIQGASVIRLPWGALLLGNQTQMLKNKRRGTLWEAPCGSQIRRAQAAGHVTMPAHKSDWTLKERWRAGFSNTFIHKHRNRAASKAFQNDVNQTNQ